MATISAAKPELSMKVARERSMTIRSGFSCVIALSDSLTAGETCRSISPLSGKTFTEVDGAAFFFIQLLQSSTQRHPSVSIIVFHIGKVIGRVAASSSQNV